MSQKFGLRYAERGMKSVLVCSLLFVVGIARADDPVAVPAIYRNSPEFYGAIGTEVAISATLSSTKIAIGETTTLTLHLAIVQNPNEVTRPPLESMPSFTSAFQIETGESKLGQRGVSFAYLLRPRSAGTVSLPRIRFRYFNPSAAEGKQMQTAYSDSLTLTVLPSLQKGEPLGKEIPERFRTLVSDSPSIATSHPLIWLVTIPITLLVVPLLASLIRISFPTVTAKARSRAAIVATKRLAAARHSSEPAGTVASALNEYLAARPDLDRTRANSLFAACDEARFSPLGDKRQSLVEEAERRLAEWEAQP